jgi:hypothetical protein
MMALWLAFLRDWFGPFDQTGIRAVEVAGKHGREPKRH